jgi:hypothetical protein
MKKSARLLLVGAMLAALAAIVPASPAAAGTVIAC